MLSILRILAAIPVAAFAGQVLAADPSGFAGVPNCPWVEASAFDVLPEEDVEAAVLQYYDEASAALKSDAVIDSYRPAFLWASEARFACGKAVGYFEADHFDAESVQKCHCFYQRMSTYR